MDDIVVELTADVVCAYVGNNSVALADLSKVIADVHGVLTRLSRGELLEEDGDEKQTPAVPIKKSVTPDYIISLEDGQKYKSLKRHLSAHYNLTPDEYREKWGLPSDYPMVAPNYAKTRSELAKKMGLGQKQRKAAPKKIVGAR